MRLKMFSKKIVIVSIFSLAVVTIIWPALFGDKVINDFFGLDLAHYKFTEDFGNAAASDQLKLWWPNYIGGFPVYLTQVGFFSPLVFILYKFFSGFAVYNWLTFLNFVLGGLAMYWLARNLSLSKVSSSVIGLAYMLSQNNLYWGPTLPFSNVYPFIPLFFLAILKISQNQKWWLFWGSLISAYGLAAGESQIVFYTLIIGFFWALFLRFVVKNWKPVLGYFSVIATGAILASFWILPVLNYLKFTTRSGSLSFSDLAYDFMRVADPLRFFYPYIQLSQFTGFESLGIVPNYYIGALTIFLAIAAIFLVKKTPPPFVNNKGWGVVDFWLGVAAFSFLVRIKWTGIFWLLHFLPGFNRFRGVFHWAYISSFALALLAGFALDNLDKIKESAYFKKFISTLKIFASANIIFAAGIFFIGLFQDKILNKIFQLFDTKIYPGKQLPLEHYHGVITSEFNKFLNAFSFTDYHFLISFLSVLIAAAFFILYQKGKINFDNFSARGGSAVGGKKLVLIFTFFNLVLIWQGYYNFIPQSKITDYPNTVQFIKNQSNSTSIQRCIEVNCRYRFFRFYPPESYQQFSVFDIKDWTDYKLKTLESNIGAYFDMENFGGVEPFMSGRIANIFDEIGYERPSTISAEPWLRSNNLTLPQKLSRFSSPQNLNLLSMLNIKYIFSSFKLPDLKLIYETTATEKNIPVYIYENTSAMPRIYFANNVKFVDSKNAFDELLKVKDFNELTIIEHETWNMKPETQKPKMFQDSSFTIQEFKPEYVKVKTSGDGGWLVYSDANLPTWEATIDGQKTTIYTANYLFKSVFVPQGEHEIVFKYPGLWGQFKYAFKNLIFNF